MTDERLVPLGVGEWHGVDVSTKKVREFLREIQEAASDASGQAAGGDSAALDDEFHERRQARLRWMFENVIRTPTGQRWSGLEDPEGFDNLGWVEGQELEAAVTAFLSRRLPAQAPRTA